MKAGRRAVSAALVLMRVLGWSAASLQAQQWVSTVYEAGAPNGHGSSKKLSRNSSIQQRMVL